MSNATWVTFADNAPDMAAQARAKFEAAKHHVLATLASDGSPRVYGVEVQFHRDDISIGMMSPSVKATQLQRDGRFALHANPGDDMGPGDVKLAGIAHEVTDTESLDAYIAQVQPPPPFHMFRLMLSDVVVTSLHPDGDRLMIQLWRPDTGVTTFER